jgi:phosphatidylglycerophosphate synthase
VTTKTAASHGPAAHVSQSIGPGEILRDLGAAALIVFSLAGATWWLLDVGASYMAAVAGFYVLLLGTILGLLPRDVPGPGVGLANRVTLARAAIAIPVGGLIVHGDPLGPIGGWWVIALSTAVLILDGVDGKVARRTGTDTAFGARFDMELDAAFIAVLSVLAWASGKVGPWVLLIGLMRYLFVFAGLFFPALRAELPESRRRKIVCVAQGVVLLVAVGPIIPSPLAEAVVLGGLASLGYSFAVDTVWTLRRGERSELET